MAVKERKALEKIVSYKAARTIESVCQEYGIDTIVKLAGNESRLGCSPKVKEALLANMDEIAFYPDLNLTILREKLQEIHHVDADQLVFGNGSFEIIQMLALAYLEEGDETIIADPTFNWYGNVTVQMGAVPVYVPLRDFYNDLEGMKNAVTDKTKIIWICNPNNPTGTLHSREEIEAFIREVPDHVLIVVDEAYIDFAENYGDSADLTLKYENVVILRTFSKLYGLASLRLGYGIAAPAVISNINKVRNPINVNMAAYVAAIASLEDEEFKNSVIKRIQASREYYYREFDKLGLFYVKASGNFIFVRTGLNGKYVEAEFLKRGYMIRSGTDYGWDDYIRISIGTEEENQRVIEILTEILNSSEG
ncbi:MAG: histidinol-phosphate transaminase [Eubacteriales bacterium]|nr:histidinol-phosphate transaminase [Eubacteriales bacterium]